MPIKGDPVIEALHNYLAHKFRYGARRVRTISCRNSTALVRGRMSGISAAAELGVLSNLRKSRRTTTLQLEPAV